MSGRGHRSKQGGTEAGDRSGRESRSGHASVPGPGPERPLTGHPTEDTPTLDAFQATADAASRRPGHRATPEDVPPWQAPFQAVDAGGIALEQSRYAWRDPGSDEVVEVDWERDERLRDLVKLMTAEARHEEDRDVRLRRLTEAPRELGFPFVGRQGPDSVDADWKAWDGRYADGRRVADVGDSLNAPHMCREASLYTHAAATRLGERSRVVYGTAPGGESGDERVRHAWVQLEDGTLLDPTSGAVHGPEDAHDLLADPETKAPMEMFRPAGSKDVQFPAPRRAEELAEWRASTEVDAGAKSASVGVKKTSSVSETALEASGTVGEDGPRIRVGAAREVGAVDGFSERREGYVAYRQGAVVLGGGQAVKLTDEAGTTTTRSRDVSGGYAYGRGPVGSVAGARVVQDDVSRVSTEGGATWDGEKASLGFGRERVLGSRDGDHLTASTRAEVDTEGGFSLARSGGSQATEPGPDGPTTTRSASQNTLGRTADGMWSAGRSHSETRVAADGGKTTAGRTMSLAAGEDGGMSVALGGHRTQVDRDGKQVSASRVAGSMTVNDRGELDELAGSTALSRGAVDASASVSLKLGSKTIDKQADGGGIVTEHNAIGGAIGAGASDKRGEHDGWYKNAGPRAKGGAHAEMSSSRKTHRRLTPSQMSAFEQTGQMPALERLALDNLTDWQVGEGIDTSHTRGLGAEGELDSGVVKATAGASTSWTSSVRIRKVARTAVDVTVEAGDSDSVQAALGNRVMSAGHSLRDSTLDKTVVRLDLDKVEDPEAVIRYIEEHGTAPLGVDGVILVSTSASEATDARTDVSLLALTAHVASGTSETVEEEPDGHRTETRRGYRGAGFMSHSFNDALTSVELDNGETRFYVRRSLTTDSAWDGQQRLAKMNNTYRDVENVAGELDDAHGDRTWSVSYEIPEAAMVEFLKKVQTGEAATWWLSDRGDGEDLKEALERARALARAGEASGLEDVEASFKELAIDEIQRAVSRLVADGGESALRAIQKTVGIAPQGDLELEGDEFLNGPAWRLEADAAHAEIEALTDRFELSEARRRYSQQVSSLKHRKSAVQDRRRYPDLPESVRRMQVRETQAMLERFFALKDKLRRKIRDDEVLARGSVEASMGAEMEAAFGQILTADERRDAEQVTAGSPDKIDHAMDATPLVQREDYEPEPITVDLVMWELQDELDAAHALDEAFEDEMDVEYRESATVRDESRDSDQEQERQHSIRLVRISVDSATASYTAAQAKMSQAAPFMYRSGFSDGLSIYKEASTHYQPMQDAIADAEANVGDSSKHVPVARFLAARVKRESMRASKAFQRAIDGPVD